MDVTIEIMLRVDGILVPVRTEGPRLTDSFRQALHDAVHPLELQIATLTQERNLAQVERKRAELREKAAAEKLIAVQEGNWRRRWRRARELER